MIRGGEKAWGCAAVGPLYPYRVSSVTTLSMVRRLHLEILAGAIDATSLFGIPAGTADGV